MRQWKDLLPLDLWAIIFKYRQAFTLDNIERVSYDVADRWIQWLQWAHPLRVGLVFVYSPIHNILDVTPYQSQNYIIEMRREQKRQQALNHLIELLPVFWGGFPQRRPKADTKRIKTTE